MSERNQGKSFAVLRVFKGVCHPGWEKERFVGFVEIFNEEILVKFVLLNYL